MASLPRIHSSRAEDPMRVGDGGPLLRWYDAKRRDLPWRRTSDPYAIWVSEAMLQQTQVATVIDYWTRWMTVFPTVYSLATADEQAVLGQWQGLGYYRRARLLHAGARWVVENGFPTTLAGWRRVPGVGPYTAGAIGSIAQNLPVPLVDGNVERVYARLTGDDSVRPALRRNAWIWTEKVLCRTRPGDWNQALMELGATICRPLKPLCGECPLADRCIARQTWRTEELPKRPPKPETVALHHVIWIPVHGDRVGISQIPTGQWWEGMWGFPRAASDGEIENAVLRQSVPGGWPEFVATFRHSVTYHRIRVDVYALRSVETTENLSWRPISELGAIPMPSPQRKALKLLLKSKLGPGA